MRTRPVLLSCLFFSAVVVMANPSTPSSADWADRMMLQKPPANTSGPDWADRLAAARPAQNPSPSHDWIARLMAGHSADFVPRSLVQIERVQAALVEAGSSKDMSRMLSLFARDATVTSGGRTYAGIDAIRTYWTNAGPFLAQSQSEGYMLTRKVRINEASDQATLQFECLWIDPATSQIRTRLYSNDVLVKDGDRWVIKEMNAGAAGQT